MCRALVRLLGSLALSTAGLLLVVPDVGQAQSIQSGSLASFQTIDPNARSRALGEATVALRGYAGAAQINPATIGRAGVVQAGTNLSGASVFQTPWPFGGRIAGPSVDVKLGRWALGYQYKGFGFEYEASYRADNEAGYVTYKADDYDEAHKLAAAFDLRPNLTIGLGLNRIRSEISTSFYLDPDQVGPPEAQSASGFSLDLGVFYEHGFAIPYVRLTPSLGWSLTDFGRPLRYGDGDQDLRDPLPMTMRGGAALRAETAAEVWRRPLLSVGLYGQLSKLLARTDVNFATGEREVYGPFRALFGTWGPYERSLNPYDPEAVTVSALDQLVTHRGLEISLMQILYLRSGFFHETEYNGARQIASGGWGIDLYYLALDRTWMSSENGFFDELSFWKLTARVPLGGEGEGNFWPDLLRYLKSNR